jgi:hypothetical protein
VVGVLSRAFPCSFSFSATFLCDPFLDGPVAVRTVVAVVSVGPRVGPWSSHIHLFGVRTDTPTDGRRP